MERINPASRSDRYGNRINRVQSPWRAAMVPYITIVLGSVLPFIILADVMPVFPPLGFMIFLGWRMIRPGLLPLWVGAPLGAFDDLFSGQPFGSGILLWSLTMIALEAIETRFPWRGFWQDWFTAGMAIILYVMAAMLISGATTTVPLMIALIPQLVLAVMLYPILSRVIAGLDRFRLSRSKRIG